MPALTPEDIGNMALNLLTEGMIESLDDDDRPARLLKLHFENTRQAELMKHAWSFAAKFPDDIEAVDSGSDDEFRYLYEFPEDFLRSLWATYDGTPTGVPITFTQWTDGWRSNFEGPLKLPYIANVTDPDDMHALFIDVWTSALAAKIAHPLTGKASMIQVAQGAYDRALEDALRVNAILKIQRLPVDSWAVARGDYRWRA